MKNTQSSYKGYLIDVYRAENKLVVWLHTTTSFFYTCTYTPSFFVEDTPKVRYVLDVENIKYALQTKQNPYGEHIDVLRIDTKIQKYERMVSYVEQITEYNAKMYNADISPEQQFLYDKRLKPMDYVDEALICVQRGSRPQLQTCSVAIENQRLGSSAITKIRFNNTIFGGTEKELLQDFTAAFTKENPDCIFMKHAFKYIPHIEERCRKHSIQFSFHRTHKKPLQYKGGKSYFSYGNVFYRHTSIRLHGRILVDTNTFIGKGCSIEGIAELAELSGTRLQQVASRSFGAVTQGGLVRELYTEGRLVPYKHKPVSKPMKLSEYIKADKGGHHMDPLVGYHEDVASIDFSSMFPSLICKYNICAEAILNNEKER